MSQPEIAPLYDVMARLRTPVSGCPWDLEQNFATIAPYTIEEAYEVADAIERDDMGALKDELGDLLLQVVFHSRMAEEAGHFGLQDVIDAICDKMERRHPHIFGDREVGGSAHVIANWEAIKQAERHEKSEDKSAMADVAKALPALLRAQKIQKRAARTGFDWSSVEGAFEKLDEEIGEVKEAATAAETHDEVWNAAQRELTRTGWMHNYLRMLWGKKILEWSRSPEEALDHMTDLMNAYAFDGRDPNSYTGYFWTLGRYDRPWAPEREIFGMIRYMSSDSTMKKWRMKPYLKEFGRGQDTLGFG